ncbi:MAG: hypothetical protein AAFN11_05360 [Chloroflexota bacterium]
MATRIQTTETRTELEALVSEWNTRWRLRRAVLYFPRVMIAAMIVAMIISVVIATLRLLPAPQMLFVTGVGFGATLALVLSAIGIWSRDGIEAARQFDTLFDLQERLTTAYELIEGRISTTDALAERQLQDTVKRAKTVDANEAMPLDSNGWDWVVMLFTLIVMILILIFATLSTINVGQEGNSAQTTAAINAAADTARDITEGVATDSALSPEERQSLLESTEQTIDELENPDIDTDESFAAMSDLESDLREQAESIREDVQDSETSLQNAANALSGEQDNPSDMGESDETLSDTLTDISESLDDATAEEQAELEQRLEEAAAALEEENNALAEDLQAAADALNSGDTAGAQQSLDDAAQAAADAESQNQTRSESADNLEAAADQASEAAGQIATTEFSNEAQTDSEVNDVGRSVEDLAPSAELDMEEDPGSSPAQPGEQPDEGESGRSVASDQQGAQSGDAPQSSGDTNSDSPQDGSGESSDGAQGDGDSASSEQSQSGSSSGDSPDQQGTGSADGGESEFDPVFAPEFSDVTTGDTTIELEADADSASVEGEFQDNPDGTSSVPYNQVFSSYAEAASSALDNGYVPLGVRDVVRDYFTSLEPTGNSTPLDDTDE